MSIKDLLNNFIGEFNKEDDYEDEDIREEDEYEDSSFGDMSSYDDNRFTKRAAQRVRKPRAVDDGDPSKIVDIHTTAKLQVVLAKPEKLVDCKTIADHLNAKRTVVLNLETVGPDVSKRILDILYGVAYANGGEMKKVASKTVIITPYNVDVSGDLLDELENTGVFF